MTAPGAVAPLCGAAEAAEVGLRAIRGGPPVATAVVVASSAPEAVPVGRRMVRGVDGAHGSLGDAALDARAAEQMERALRSDAGPGVVAIEADGVRCDLFVEVHASPPELVIVGAGHIARPLARIGAMLGMRVVVLDDRPEFATRERFPEAHRLVRADFAAPFADVPLSPTSHLVLVTRGHRYDYDALRDALRLPWELAYVGMVGSRRRVRAALRELAADGIPRERLLRVNAPIGLDIGAETPEEIAVAVAAEIVRLRRGGTGAPLRDRERVVERWLSDGKGGAEGG